MHQELQLPILNDTVLQSMYCIIELTISYTNRPVYIACKDENDYNRILAKILKDYRTDNYIFAASKHFHNANNFIENEQIMLTL